MTKELGVYPGRPSAIQELMSAERVLIGAVHLPALPGSPTYSGQAVSEIADYGLAEARTYLENGFTSIIVENHWDMPFQKPGEHGYETAAAMAVITRRIVEEFGPRVGVSILSNAGECSIAAAHAAGAGWIRVNQWANAYVANEGIIEGQAAKTTRFRSRIQAHDIRVFADVHVKHGAHAIVADRTLAEQTEDAEFFAADVLIATGSRTGSAASPDEVRGIRQNTILPVIIGSGITADNVSALLDECNGAIVASSVKDNGRWWGRADAVKVAAVSQAAGL